MKSLGERATSGSIATLVQLRLKADASSRTLWFSQLSQIPTQPIKCWLIQPPLSWLRGPVNVLTFVCRVKAYKSPNCPAIQARIQNKEYTCIARIYKIADVPYKHTYISESASRKHRNTRAGGSWVLAWAAIGKEGQTRTCANCSTRPGGNLL